MTKENSKKNFFEFQDYFRICVVYYKVRKTAPFLKG